MKTQREERIGSLAGVECARRELPSFLSTIGNVLNKSLGEDSVLSLSESNAIRAELRMKIQMCLASSSLEDHLLLPPSQRDQFDSELATRTARFGRDEVLLSLGTFDGLPLLRVTPSEVCEHFYDFWKVGDTVTMCSSDMTSGMMADWYPDDPEQAFEIASWGVQ